MDEKWMENPGCWNAYVASGRTQSERKRRLEQVPEHLRESVKRHAITVYGLRNRR